MAKINTLNYQTVASWNGSQDLFIVEQPDGTKVATPAMVKQFIEAGDFEATGEVKDGHGNVLKDMAKSSEIGDLSQTGLTGDNVAEQLSQLNDEIDNLIKYTDIAINASTSGHGTPARSSAGAYYEPLATYAALGVTRDKILSINLIDWNSITKSFTPYLGSSTVSAMTDSESSIYAASGVSNVVMRVVYKN
jgi:hypothetical protein